MSIFKAIFLLFFSLAALFLTPSNYASMVNRDYQTHVESKNYKTAISHRLKTSYILSTRRVQDFKKYKSALDIKIGRYLDTDSGTFTQVDPMQHGMNWYSYVGGDPVNYTDPSGYEGFSAGAGAAWQELKDSLSAATDPDTYRYLRDKAFNNGDPDALGKLIVDEIIPGSLNELVDTNTMIFGGLANIGSDEGQKHFTNGILRILPAILAPLAAAKVAKKIGKAPKVVVESCELDVKLKKTSGPLSPKTPTTGIKPSLADDDLLLGLNSNGRLQGVAKEFGGKTFGKFPTSKKVFTEQIKEIMENAKSIGFDLSDVNINELSGRINRLTKEPLDGYTNYELFLLKNNPNLLKKTTFFKDGFVTGNPFQ